MKGILLVTLLLLFSVSCSISSDNTAQPPSESYESDVKKYDTLDFVELMHELSFRAIEMDDYEFVQKPEGWIGFDPCTDTDIALAEKRLNIEFPFDYVHFLKITNGFPAVNSIEPSFLPINQIDYTKNIDPSILEFGNSLPEEISDKYERSIFIGGIDEEQAFLLIPPKKSKDMWEYWKFAYWIPGEERYNSLRDYFEFSAEFCEEIIKED